MDIVKYEYIFDFNDGKKINYIIDIDINNKIINKTNVDYSNTDVKWTNLDYFQCSHCPFTVANMSKCPIAVHLYNMIKTFQNNYSIDDVMVTVKTAQRDYIKQTPLQYGLQSLFGLLMPASGCPRMKFLSKLTPFHLPFADVDETIVRVSSMFLLNQYFQKNNGDDASFSLEGLKTMYDDVTIVNQGIISRIRSISNTGDATINAITILNAFVQFFSYEFNIDLKGFKHFFN